MHKLAFRATSTDTHQQPDGRGQAYHWPAAVTGLGKNPLRAVTAGIPSPSHPADQLTEIICPRPFKAGQKAWWRDPGATSGALRWSGWALLQPIINNDCDGRKERNGWNRQRANTRNTGFHLCHKWCHYLAQHINHWTSNYAHTRKKLRLSVHPSMTSLLKGSTVSANPEFHWRRVCGPGDWMLRVSAQDRCPASKTEAGSC